VVNEVVKEYNDLGMLVKEYQEHAGAKGASTPYVGYNYDTTAASGEFTKGLRPTSLRYPNNRLVHYTYGSSGSADDSMNRLAAIKDDSSGSPGATLASYTYLGLGTVVITDYEEPDIKLDLFGNTSGTYAGFDRFDRVQDQLWLDYGPDPDVDTARIKHGYDRAGNRLWREDTVAGANSKHLDELYTYDGIYRLKTFKRGDLSSSKDGINTGTLNFQQEWGSIHWATGRASRKTRRETAHSSWTRVATTIRLMRLFQLAAPAAGQARRPQTTGMTATVM
jgi:hypothetical protein